MVANVPEASVNLSFDVQPPLFSVFCPGLFQCTGLLLRRDSESCQCQNQCTHANMVFRTRACQSTTGAGHHRRSEISAGPDSVKAFRPVRLVSR